ncbi:MAG: single-stranded DNA-binding protein [Hydrococcus sp. SU_1_0]|nr:single-stranded DNA-binding protein [Hydrococcus sp. SU_1_0]
MAVNNTVILVGNLGIDPTVHSDKRARRLSALPWRQPIAGKIKKPKNGTTGESVWHTCFAFSTSAKQYASYFKKGQRVKVTGAIVYREGEMGEQKYRDAVINARKIEPAPLLAKNSMSKESVSEVSGTAGGIW